MQIFMNFNYHALRILPIMALFYVLGYSALAAAETPQTAACPKGGMAHQHMGHSAGNGMAQNAAGAAIQQLADAQCSSCHGVNGISINDNIPNLSGQELVYLCGWLAGCRNQGDKCEGHEDIAGKLSDQDIVNFAEFYAHLPAHW